jgi:NitT/TauT family transport system ATP-binding protein
MNRAPEIVLDSVGKRASDRPNVWLLEQIKLEIVPRQRLFLVGPNGSGKSTLLRMILGFESVDTGGITVSPPLSELSISYMPQDYRSALFPWFNLSRNLSLALKTEVDSSSTTHKLHEFNHLSKLFRLEPSLARYPYELSGGEQQLFLLIIAMIRKPVLLVLDEPFSAIDFGRRQSILTELGMFLNKEPSTVIAVTHDFEDAVLLADRILVLDPKTTAIREGIDVPFAWPRRPALRNSALFRDLIQKIIEATL